MNENEHMNNGETTPETESTTETVSTEAASTMAVEETAASFEAKPEESIVEVVHETPSETDTDTALEAVTTIDDIVSEPAGSPKEKTVAVLAAAGAWIKKRRYTIAAVVLVIIAVIGMLYILEERGRIHTGAFDGVKKFTAAYKTVAKVNDGKITQADLNTSMTQLSANAEAQGADLSDPETKSQLRTQALDMLVNTELLKQEAAKRDIAITDEDVTKRIEQLTTDVGGEEVLKERMMQFGIDEKTLRHDVKNELTIQALLDQIFTEKGLAVTEEEIKDFYDQAGGTKAGLPKLEEVRDQIEAQLKQSKQQEIVTSFIEEVKKTASIEIL